MNVDVISGGWKLAMQAGEKKKEQLGAGAAAGGGGFAGALASLSQTTAQAVKAADSSQKTSISSVKEKDGIETFLDYMNKTPAQRMEDAWLSQHKMTRAQLNSLPPEEQEKIRTQMRAEIEEKIKQGGHAALGSKVEILV